MAGSRDKRSAPEQGGGSAKKARTSKLQEKTVEELIEEFPGLEVLKGKPVAFPDGPRAPVYEDLYKEGEWEGSLYLRKDDCNPLLKSSGSYCLAPWHVGGELEEIRLADKASVSDSMDLIWCGHVLIKDLLFQVGKKPG